MALPPRIEQIMNAAEFIQIEYCLTNEYINFPKTHRRKSLNQLKLWTNRQKYTNSKSHNKRIIATLAFIKEYIPEIW